LISGTATITTASSATTTVTGLAAGSTATLRWTISNGSCTASTDDVIITNNALPTTANAGADIAQCNNGSFTMAANTPTVGTGAWSLISGTATITTASSATTTVTGLAAGSTATLRWTISNGSCTASFDNVIITNNGNNSITLTSAAGTANQQVLQNSPINTITYSTVSATGATFSGLPTGVTGSWNANIVTISGTPTVSGVFNYTVTLTGGCPSANNSASGTMESVAVNPIYSHNFSDLPASNSNYTANPLYTSPAGVFSNGLSASSWTATSGGVATTFTNVTNVSGSRSIAFNPGSNQTSTLKLTFQVSPGYTASINSFNFGRSRQTTSSPNIASITINGTTVFAGETSPTAYANIGTTLVSNAVTNLTGLVSVVINLTASNENNGNRWFYLDDFVLNGSVTSPNPYAEVYLHNFNDIANTSPYTTSPTATTGIPAGVFNSNFVAGTSSWSSSTGALTNTVDNNGGKELALLTPLNATSSLTLVFSVACGYALDIDAFDFFQQRQTVLCSNISSITVNGTQIYGGSTAPIAPGANIGITAVANPVNNLTGQVTVVINLTASNEAAGNRYFYLDDFTLYGTVVATNTNPAQPATISGNATQCPAQTSQVYSVAAVTYATSYNWTLPAGWSITAGAGTNSITVTTGAAGQNGNISVTASNICATSAAQTIAVVVNPGAPAQPAAISGTAAQCPAVTAQTYSIAAVSNATTYNWSVPTGWTITAGAGTTSITVTTGAAGQNGNVSVTAQNSCGTSVARTLAVTVNPGTPAQPGSISGTAAQCPGVSSQTYSIAAVSNATTYNWSVPTGWTITAGAGTTSITVTTGAAGQN
ncbi:MAG: hypothetical protein ACKOSR_07050, partial [Flavobacteriales bacterium]